jgi:hypothetical protein
MEPARQRQRLYGIAVCLAAASLLLNIFLRVTGNSLIP